MRVIPFLLLTVSLGVTLPVGMAIAEETAAPIAAEPVLPAITVTEVSVGTVHDRVITSGLIGPVEEVQVQPLIEGQPLELLLADVGDTVSAGQVLAILSKSTLDLQMSEAVASLAAAKATIAQAEAQLIEAEASAAEAQRVAERTTKLGAQGSAPQAQADTANANAISATARVTVARQSLESAKAQAALSVARLENARLQLSRTEVTAPVDGEIVERNALIGGIATAASQPMFVIVRDGALELRAEIAESDILRLAVGQRATLHAVGMEAALTGKVRLVDPSIDTTTRLGQARITVDEPDLLRSGMFVEAEILVVERNSIVVPVTAIGSAANAATVMRVKNGTVERVVVKTGIRDGGFVEILEGLSVGDLVVTKAGAFVRPGDKINPVPAVTGTN